MGDAMLYLGFIHYTSDGRIDIDSHVRSINNGANLSGLRLATSECVIWKNLSHTGKEMVAWDILSDKHQQQFSPINSSCKRLHSPKWVYQ